jgi:tetratricopeptide (TPR) repeat protein
VAPYRYQVPLADEPAAALSHLDSVEDVLAWYDSERENVLAAIRQAAATGLHDVAWQLPATLLPVFNRRNNWADCIIANRIGVDSARRTGHRAGEAWVLQNLGQALAKLRDKEAFPVLEQALTIRREIGDRTGEAQTAITLADAYHKLRGPEAALEHSLYGLEVLREVGNASLLGIGLNNHGEYCLELGRLDEAAEYFREARDIWEGIGAYGKGYALHNLGHVYLESGHLDDAIATLNEAYRAHQASGDLSGQALALKYLGQAWLAVGDEEEARKAWTRALVIFESLEAVSDAAEIRTALAALSPGQPPTAPRP